MNSVGWFEIYVDDINRAKAFYEAVFQQTLEKLDSPMEGLEMWAFPGEMTEYGAMGALACMPGVSAGGNSILVYFSCEDCSVEEGRVEAAGGKVVQGKFSIGPYGHISIITDSEGNTIGLHSES